MISRQNKTGGSRCAGSARNKIKNIDLVVSQRDMGHNLRIANNELTILIKPELEFQIEPPGQINRSRLLHRDAQLTDHGNELTVDSKIRQIQSDGLHETAKINSSLEHRLGNR